MRFIVVFIIVCLVSCKDAGIELAKTDVQLVSSELVVKGDIESLKYVEFLPDQKVVKQINNWEKHTELERLILDVKDANFSFFNNNEEIVNTLCEEFKNTIPETMNTPQILSRIIALETKIFKLESVVNLSNVEKNQTLAAVKELLVAFSNLNLQMNKKVEKESQNIKRPN